MNGFQSNVNAQPAPGEPGDFAGTNPRMSAQAPAGGYVASAEGCFVGRFAWGNPRTGIMSNGFQANSVLGFIHRENQAIIVPFLAFEEMNVQAGLPVTAMSRGDFWARFLAGATIGQKVYANAVTGQASADETGQGTQSLGYDAAIATDGVMTVSGSGVGTIEVGMAVVAPGVPPGTYIVSEGSGSGGTGTYNISYAPAVAISAQATDFYGLIETPWYVGTTVPVDAEFTGEIAGTGIMTVSAIAAGVLQAGLFISGEGVAPNTYIISQLTGDPGDVGDYRVNNYVEVAETALVGKAGQLAKITNWQTG